MNEKSIHEKDPSSIEFATPHYSMSFKAGETITDYKMSNKTNQNSNRQPIEKFIDQFVNNEEANKKGGGGPGNKKK